MLGARPEVFNHNIETVRRLHRRMRGAKAAYDKALWLLRRAKEVADYPVLTKSGIIVGLGETNDEVVETMRDLRAHGVDVVTIGQYLQPSRSTRDRPLGAPRRVPLVARAGRGARFRLGLRRARWCARATAPTSSGTRPRPAAAPSRTSRDEGPPPGDDPPFRFPALPFPETGGPGDAPALPQSVLLSPDYGRSTVKFGDVQVSAVEASPNAFVSVSWK